MAGNPTSDTIALVTGSNKGLGFELIRQLSRAGITAILSARNESAGKEACRKLQAEGLPVNFVRLDVTDPVSISAAAEFIRNTYGKLDILINNAGILPDEDSEASGLHVSPDLVRRVFETNTLGPLQVCQAMIPLIRLSSAGRILNISSGLGSLNDMDRGYPAYRISKAALNAVTRILAAELIGTGITVNSICPGWVQTDMGGPNAERTPAQSEAGIIPVLLSKQDRPNGEFLRDGKPIPW
jgi:NAD(P)-dependent dehydrogenase (short-subunit alcohol dehydrogenase family)